MWGLKASWYRWNGKFLNARRPARRKTQVVVIIQCVIGRGENAGGRDCTYRCGGSCKRISSLQPVLLCVGTVGENALHLNESDSMRKERVTISDIDAGAKLIRVVRMHLHALYFNERKAHYES
jgi:hypothetical protein